MSEANDPERSGGAASPKSEGVKEPRRDRWIGPKCDGFADLPLRNSSYFPGERISVTAFVQRRKKDTVQVFDLDVFNGF